MFVGQSVNPNCQTGRGSHKCTCTRLTLGIVKMYVPSQISTSLIPSVRGETREHAFYSLHIPKGTLMLIDFNSPVRRPDGDQAGFLQHGGLDKLSLLLLAGQKSMELP